MRTWEDFPKEVRRGLLEALCRVIIEDFESLKHSAVKDADKKYFDEYEPLFHRIKGNPPQYKRVAYPPGPIALKSFMSAITTCREFNDIITREITFHGKSTGAILLEQQRANVESYIDQEQLAFSHFWHQLAGRFWKNPGIIADPELLVKAVRSMPIWASHYWPPHIEDWLMYHARDAPPNPFSLDEEVEEGSAPEGVLDWVESLDNEGGGDYFEMYVMYGSKRVEFTRYKRFSTVKGVVKMAGEEEDQTLAAQDIRSSPAEQWWLLPETSYGADDSMGNATWVLINFVGKRMYVLGNRHEVLVWDDQWDARSWKTFTTLEEIRNHRKN